MIKLTTAGRAAIRINIALTIVFTLLDMVNVGALYAAFLVGAINYFYVVHEINKVLESSREE